MNNATQNFKTKSNQLKTLMIVAMVVFLLLLMLVWMLSSSTHESKEVVEKSHFSDPLQHADSESSVLEKVQRGIEDTKKQTEELKKQFEDQANSAKDNKEKALEERLSALEDKMNATPVQLNTPIGMNGGSGVNQPPLDDSMREDTLTVTSIDPASRRPLKNPETYVPAGTFAQAVMLSGADASAAVTSSHNPNPMIFRIISNGTLPNNKKSHLKGCIVTAYVSGDISSERGEIDLYKMSCTLPNDQIIDPKVEGWIFGRDGKFGIRGNPVWREGKLLQRAFAAGALSGISDGLSQSYTTNSISAEGNIQTVNSGKIASYGIAKGTGKAMDKLADYNIQRAEQYHPVIQISPGDVVDVVFKDGFFLDGKNHEHDDDNNREIPNMFDAGQPTTDSSVFPPESGRTLPLSNSAVETLKENSKQLGFRVTGGE